MNYDELEGWRKLDHMVEQRVFDRVPCDKWRHEYGGWGMAITGAGEIWVKGKCEHDDCYPEQYPPKRSTDIAATEEVVKEMARRGFTAHIEWKGKGREFEYTAEVTFLDHGILGLGHAVADTISLAACIAALEALDASNNKEQQ